jgi:endonuclease/exonuclease/phosphatase family metal-dependent hydrolase
MLLGDFNLVRFISDKSNGVINHKWVDSFNSWVDRWALIKLNAPNKKFTRTNKQERPILAKIDRIFVMTHWESAFPLISIRALERLPSDHNPLRINLGDNVSFGKKRLDLKNGGLKKNPFKI